MRRGQLIPNRKVFSCHLICLQLMYCCQQDGRCAQLVYLLCFLQHAAWCFHCAWLSSFRCIVWTVGLACPLFNVYEGHSKSSQLDVEGDDEWIKILCQYLVQLTTLILHIIYLRYFCPAYYADLIIQVAAISNHRLELCHHPPSNRYCLHSWIHKRMQMFQW